MTAWAIAFACMVLVGTLSLADGLASGVASVTERIRSGPNVYIRGTELLRSEIDPDGVAGIPGTFVAVRAHPAELTINGRTFPIVAVALVDYRDGERTVPFPDGTANVSLDVGLRTRIETISGTPVEPVGDFSAFDLPNPIPLRVVPPPPSRSILFPDDWAYVHAELLGAMSLERGGPIQAIVSDVALDPAVVRQLGLAHLETIGAIGFVRGGVAQAQASLRMLGVLIAVVIGLLVYAAMSLEVHQRAGEIATLRRLGASPRTVGGVYELQALVLASAGATLGAALGIVAAHAIVSFAPLFGLPHLVVLHPPFVAIGLTLAIALSAALVAGLVPSRRAAVLARSREAVPS